MALSSPSKLLFLDDTGGFSPMLLNLYSAGGLGKSRLGASAPRGWPEQFGTKIACLCADPASERLDSILQADKGNVIKVGIDWSKEIFVQVRDFIRYDWKSMGCITGMVDTFTTIGGHMLSQVTNSGRFSDKHIQVSEGVNQPMPGDYGACNTLIMNLIRFQQQSKINWLNLYHELEVRPEAGEPGDVYGGPQVVGKALTKTMVNQDITSLRLMQKRIQGKSLGERPTYQRMVVSETQGIWQAKLRSGHLTNPIPEIPMDPDPVNVWHKLKEVLS